MTTAAAGETIACGCGNRLQVPTMRGLRELQTADAPPAAGPRGSWGDRQRIGFLFALGSVTCLLVAGYLWAGLPEIPQPPTTEQFGEIVDQMPQSDLLALHRQATEGLRPMPNPLEATFKTRQMMVWGIGIVLTLALLAAASACLVAWNTPRRKA